MEQNTAAATTHWKASDMIASAPIQKLGMVAGVVAFEGAAVALTLGAIAVGGLAVAAAFAGAMALPVLAIAAVSVAGSSPIAAFGVAAGVVGAGMGAWGGLGAAENRSRQSGEDAASNRQRLDLIKLEGAARKAGVDTERVVVLAKRLADGQSKEASLASLIRRAAEPGEPVRFGIDAVEAERVGKSLADMPQKAGDDLGPLLSEAIPVKSTGWARAARVGFAASFGFESFSKSYARGIGELSTDAAKHGVDPALVAVASSTWSERDKALVGHSSPLSVLAEDAKKGKPGYLLADADKVAALDQIRDISERLGLRRQALGGPSPEHEGQKPAPVKKLG